VVIKVHCLKPPSKRPTTGANLAKKRVVPVGFTIAELIIGITLMGVLSAMAVPAMLNQTSESRSNAAIVRDAALSISAAFANYQRTGKRQYGLPGTITVTSGSTAVPGTSTTFNFHFVPGDIIETASGARRTVKLVNSNTSITVDANWSATETGVTYSVIRPVESISRFEDMLDYINFVKSDTTTNASSVPSGETALQSCAVARPCLTLQSGALLQYGGSNTFGGDTPDNYVTLAIDPDATENRAGKVTLLLYANGRVVSGSNAYGTTGSNALTTVTDPSWLGNLGG
jgi:type II secretory pathway pseudopilin PulG